MTGTFVLGRGVLPGPRVLHFSGVMHVRRGRECVGVKEYRDLAENTHLVLQQVLRDQKG